MARGLEALADTGAQAVSGPVVQVVTTRASAALERQPKPIDFGHRRRLNVPVDTANVAVLRTTMLDLPFDEALLRIEDANWASRAAEKGVTAVFAPEMRVEHRCEEHLAGAINKRITTGWCQRAARLRWPETVADTHGQIRAPHPRRARLLRRIHRGVTRSDALIQAEVFALLLAANALEASLPLLTRRAVRAGIVFLIDVAESLGQAMHAAGYEAPSVSDVRKRSIRRVMPTPPAP